MKQSSIYVDPAELKAKNQKQPMAQMRQPTHRKAPQQQSEATVALTKDDIKEITKEAYEEGLKAAQQQQPKQPQQSSQQPAQPQAQESKANKEGKEASDKHEEKDDQNTSHPKHQGSPKQPEGTKETQDKFDKIVERNNYVLFQSKSMFPIDLFPDTIIIDMTKVTIINKSFFATEHVTAIPLKSIADVFMQTSLFTAAIIIQYMPHTDRPGVIEPVEAKILGLPRQEAIIAKDLMRGMVIAHEDNIDLTNVRLEDLREKLQELGTTKTDV